jgi:hypothetical protein
VSFYASRMCGVLTLATVASIAAVPGNALTLKECSAKYRAAQSGGTTGGLSWQAFRQANCGASAYAPAGATAAFPKAISAKYAKEPAGKARMHTCLDQYHANKATNSNGGLRWIAKGGGYYSECNKRLKG